MLRTFGLSANSVDAPIARKSYQNSFYGDTTGNELAGVRRTFTEEIGNNSNHVDYQCVTSSTDRAATG